MHGRKESGLNTYTLAKLGKNKICQGVNGLVCGDKN